MVSSSRFPSAQQRRLARVNFMTVRATLQDRGGYFRSLIWPYTGISECPTMPDTVPLPEGVTPFGIWCCGAKPYRWMCQVGRPVAMPRIHRHEASAQLEQRMPNLVGDRQHLVAQRRHQLQVDLLHLERHSALQATGLHEMSSRQEARLVKRVGPSTGHMHLQLVLAAIGGPRLERRGALSGQNPLHQIDQSTPKPRTRWRHVERQEGVLWQRRLST